jgi:hypothetical protein
MLKKELEDWVNAQFDLVRLWYGDPEIARATVLSKEAGGAMLIFRAGLSFKEEYAKALDAKVQKLAAYDLSVVKIEYDHVKMRGPSRRPEFKDRYFEVVLKANKDAFTLPDPGKMGKPKLSNTNGGRMPPIDKPLPDPNIEPVDTRPKESTYDAKTDTWTIGTDDYKNMNVDDLAKYAKVVHDRNGNPLGIQITDEIPDDNVVVARGGRKGDIIKAINGKPVLSMADVRRIVREDYNAGVTEFRVNYEREGVPYTKTFNAPAKKKTDK